MSEEATSKSSKVWLYVVSLLVGLPLLYVLSVGPAMVVLLRSPAASGPFAAFSATYAPLFLAAKGTGTDGALNAYVATCMRLVGMDPAAFQ